MADKNAFDFLVEDVLQDDVERQAMRNMASKYKEVKDGYLRQSDYSKQMNSLKADKDKFDSERDKIEGKLTKLQEWEAWRQSNWDDGQAMTKREIQKLEQINDLTFELEILKQAQEAGMTFDEVGQYIDKELGKKNLVSKDYLDKEFKKDLIDRATYEKDLNTKIGGVANGMEYIYTSTLPAVLKHKDEFGEILDPVEIIKYANENGYKKIDEAYERMVAPKRAEIQTKKNEEALKLAKEEGRKEALKERGMGNEGQRPVDDGPPVMGHLERRLRGPKDETDKPIEGPLGTVGNQVADRFRREKAEGKTDSVIAQFARSA
jgi:hypothetical protein